MRRVDDGFAPVRAKLEAALDYPGQGPGGVPGPKKVERASQAHHKTTGSDQGQKCTWGSPGADSKHPNETERGPLEKKYLRSETATKQATKQANETERGPLDFFRSRLK